MNWHSWSEFLAMGGYGLYVWGSYLVSAVVIAAEISVLVRRGRTLRARAGRTAGPESDQ